MFEVKFLYFFVYKTIVTMSRRSDLTNLKDKEIHDLLWEQEELPVDPLEDSSFDESWTICDPAFITNPL